MFIWYLFTYLVSAYNVTIQIEQNIHNSGGPDAARRRAATTTRTVVRCRTFVSVLTWRRGRYLLLASCLTTAKARRGESNALQHAGGTEAGRRPPLCPALPAVRTPVCRWASLAAQAFRNENVVIGVVRVGFTSLVPLFSVHWQCNWCYYNSEDAVCTTWRRVVDMSLSAPVQAVRGTRTNSLDQLDFQERRQLIASSLSLTDFLHVGAKEVAAVAGQFPFPFCHCMPRHIPNNSFAKLKLRA